MSADCIFGWAIVPEGIHEIRVYLQGRPIGVAHLNLPRPDVAAALPDLPPDVAGRSGFFFKMPAGDGSWTQPEVRLVLVQKDRVEHEIYRGVIISPGSFTLDPRSARSPFPSEVGSLLAALDPAFATGRWSDDLIREAGESIVRLVSHSSKEIVGLYPWLRYLKAMWVSFEFIQTHFPRFGEADPSRKDAISAANSSVEMLAIASHLYVLRSHGLPGHLLEFGCFKGFSTAMLSLACRDLSIRMEVFDSFEGLPTSESSYYSKGEFAGSLDEVRHHVTQFGAPEVVEFHPGFFDRTVGERARAAAVYLDGCGSRQLEPGRDAAARAPAVPELSLLPRMHRRQLRIRGDRIPRRS